MDKKAKCSKKKCGWIGLESEMREVLIRLTPFKETELHCPRCDGNSFYYKLKPDEVETPKTGAQLIELERTRQIKIEGWTPEHDDEHVAADLCIAGACYAIMGSFQICHHSNKTCDTVDQWPWDKRAWKPSPDPIRNLVKAGALIAAEIDRLQRLAVKN
jgi:hypothetical protein